MAELPATGPLDVWGGELKTWLLASRNADGSLSADAVQNALGGSVSALIGLHGGDATGATASDAAFAAALASLPDYGDGYKHGKIELAQGTYRFDDPLPNVGPHVYVVGQGRFATIINFHGTGDCFRLYSNLFPMAFQISSESHGGGFLDMCIDGTNAGAGSCGIHFGDVESIDIERVCVRNFSGAGSKGIWQDNHIWWTEKAHVHAMCFLNTRNYYASVTVGASTTIATGVTLPAASIVVSSMPDDAPRPNGGTSGTAPQFTVDSQTVTYTGVTDNGDGTFTLTGCSGGTGAVTAGDAVTFGSAGASMGYCDIDITIFSTISQDGFVVENGPDFYSGRIKIRGNMTGGDSGVAALKVLGTAPAGTRLSGTRSLIQFCELDVQVESGGATPSTQTIFCDAGNQINACIGILRFGGTWTAANFNQATGRMQFLGFIIGDANLNPANGNRPIALSAMTYTVGSAASGSLHVGDGDFFEYILTASTTISVSGTTVGGPMRKTVVLHQAASGGPYTVTWPSTASPTLAAPTVKWAGGTAPTMSTGASAIDVYELSTLDGKTWYGRAIQNVS